MPEQPDERHRPPDGVDEATIAAAGKVREAYEWVVRARGELYGFHQMIGHADATLGDALDGLRDAGHTELADELAGTWLGRNAVFDRWTFEIVEAFDATYLQVATAGDQRVRDELLDGRLHVHEAAMKAERRTDGPTDDTP